MSLPLQKGGAETDVDDVANGEAGITEVKSGTMRVRVHMSGRPCFEVLVAFSDRYTTRDLKREVAKSMGKSEFPMDLFLQPACQLVENNDTLLAELNYQGPHNRLCFSARESKVIEPRGHLEEMGLGHGRIEKRAEQFRDAAFANIDEKFAEERAKLPESGTQLSFG